MLDVLDVPDLIAPRADRPSPVLECFWTDCGAGTAWVQVTGELDIATATPLQRALGGPQARVPLVVLDLRELTFMDSSGVHAIVNASNRARDAGRRLIVVRGPPNVDRMFARAGVADVVEIADVSSLLALIEDEPSS